MLEHFFAPGNLPFAVALLLMVFIGLLEGVSTVLGAGLSGVFDNLLPDWGGGIDLESAEFSAPGALAKLLGWLHVGKVPLLVLLVVFLLAFGLLGLFLQSALMQLFGRMLPPVLAVVPVGFVSLGVVRVAGAGLARIIPKDETTAVSRASFVGRVGVVLGAPASRGNPSQAKLRDQHGQTHYVLVEPDHDDEIFAPGSQVVLISKQGVIFRAIKTTSAALVAND